jgi:hypothetical protein
MSRAVLALWSAVVLSGVVADASRIVRDREAGVLETAAEAQDRGFLPKESQHWQPNGQEAGYGQGHLPEAGPISGGSTSFVNPGSSRLIQLCESGSIEDIEAVIQSGDSVDEIDRNGWSALIHASAEGRVVLVDLLLKSSAKVDFADVHDGWTALFHVSANGGAVIARMLLDNGANLSHTDVQVRQAHSISLVDTAPPAAHGFALHNAAADHSPPYPHPTICTGRATPHCCMQRPALRRRRHWKCFWSSRFPVTSTTKIPTTA